MSKKATSARRVRPAPRTAPRVHVTAAHREHFEDMVRVLRMCADRMERHAHGVQVQGIDDVPGDVVCWLGHLIVQLTPKCEEPARPVRPDANHGMVLQACVALTRLYRENPCEARPIAESCLANVVRIRELLS